MKTLTAGSFTVVTEIPLLRLHRYPRLIPHGVDLRHAEFGVQSEEEASSPNGQVVLTPVPQVLQVLVVDGRERIHADNGRRGGDAFQPSHTDQQFTYLTVTQTWFMEAGLVSNVVSWNDLFLPPGGSVKHYHSWKSVSPGLC